MHASITLATVLIRLLSMVAEMPTTTCVVSEPMIVSPFTLSTSYTFMGSCERVLLQSCDSSINFTVRIDFIADSMKNGAVGVFLVSGRSLIITITSYPFLIDYSLLVPYLLIVNSYGCYLNILLLASTPGRIFTFTLDLISEKSAWS